ncbi:hypothetical protein ACJ73_08120 [Blastomyces percursus]|uniref:HNH nuclease domain-containing protein n=1 Tax=Blastomyces percursus TaxID=1658174 RepID=A0A1J9PXB1_9EURO|nr:hypothetical protein ACJ73_08120 [Blastomyces percursus]
MFYDQESGPHGRQPVTAPLDGVLTDPTYYFLVDAGASKYLIVRSFQDWEFPRDCIPDAWGPHSVFPEPGRFRCGITNFSTCTEEAHLVPKEELLWHYRNWMSKYCTNLGDIDDSVNIVSLRPDIHRCFDKRWFVIAPKVAGGGGAPEVVTAGDSRHVVRLQASTGVEDVELEWKAEFLSGAQLRASYSGGGPKSATSKERKPELDALGEDNDLAESRNNGDIGMENDGWVDVMDE